MSTEGEGEGETVLRAIEQGGVGVLTIDIRKVVTIIGEVKHF